MTDESKLKFTDSSIADHAFNCEKAARELAAFRAALLRQSFTRDEAFKIIIATMGGHYD